MTIQMMIMSEINHIEFASFKLVEKLIIKKHQFYLMNKMKDIGRIYLQKMEKYVMKMVIL